MSVIAWDGKVIAADRQVQVGAIAHAGRKLVRLDDGVVLGWTRSAESGLALMNWWKSEGQKQDWPDCQKSDDDWARMIVACNGRVFYYEKLPEKQFVDPPFAWGAGGELALGAMAAGATAVRAVEIASRYNPYCGMGVDYFEHA